MALPFVAGAVRIAQLVGGSAAFQGATRVAGSAWSKTPGWGKGLATGVAVGYPAMAINEWLKYKTIHPALGLGGAPAAAPAAPAAPAANTGFLGTGAGAPPGMAEFMYGTKGFEPPWQKSEGFMDRQLRQQAEMGRYAQDTIRMRDGNNLRLGMEGIRGQTRIADMFSSRQLQGIDMATSRQLQATDLMSQRNLEGLQDTNRTRLALADRELAGLYDSNASRVRMARIAGDVAMHQADRSVEVARWAGAPARIATFGALMR